jgi:hypothetical protein
LLGDRSAAAVLRDRLAPFQGRIAGATFSISRPVDQALCQLALTLDDLDGATAMAHRAIAASRRRGTPIFLGRELVLFAAARIRAGDTGGELAALVDEAHQIADATGAHLINQEAERYGLT